MRSGQTCGPTSRPRGWSAVPENEPYVVEDLELVHVSIVPEVFNGQAIVPVSKEPNHE